MCGIIGYFALTPDAPPARDAILDGLRRLEYRGYDSAGIALLTPQNEIQTQRAVGPLSELETKLSQLSTEQQQKSFHARTGIGHTRWATHGAVTETNAHPHRAQSVTIVVNGIIENYLEIKAELKKSGAHIQSDTDSELAAHLLDKEYRQNHSSPLEPIFKVMKKLEGSYTAVWLVEGENSVSAIRNGAPLIVGRSRHGLMLASDINALAGNTQECALLKDGAIIKLSQRGVEAWDEKGQVLALDFQPLNLKTDTPSTEGYPHFMLKEIHEQPESLVQTLAGKVDFTQNTLHPFLKNISVDRVKKLKRVVLVACGSAYHAALEAKYILERESGIYADVDLASEFRYRDTPLNPEDSMCIAVTQSGETADTLAAVKKAKDAKLFTLVVTNVALSSIAREADELCVTMCGPEIGVASTKAFTAQVLALQLIAMSFSKMKGHLTPAREKEFVQNMAHLPSHLRDTLKTLSQTLNSDFARQLKNFKTFLFIGRGQLFPIALEGALKFKEITYLHAEGYAAGELKHGPIAMVDKETLCLVLQGFGLLGQKTHSNMEEVRARGSSTITIGDINKIDVPSSLPPTIHKHITIPKTHDDFLPYDVTLPVQLIAYHMAVNLGHNPDRPRNLAKSVTVE